MSNSTDDRNSRYVQGGLTEKFAKRLGWWSRYKLRKEPTTDFEFVITNKYHMRPDVLAYDFYGRADYFFIILQFNGIIDITTEFIAGKQIVLPQQSRVAAEFLNKQPGGVE